jgi:hypothetical protein
MWGASRDNPITNAAEQLHTIYTYQPFEVGSWYFDIPIQEHGCIGSSLMEMSAGIAPAGLTLHAMAFRFRDEARSYPVYSLRIYQTGNWIVPCTLRYIMRWIARGNPG